MVAELSAVNDLLCMRRLTRLKSVTKPSSLGLRTTKGLNRRTSMFGWLSNEASTASSPAVPLSSSSRRTRTPLSAASCKASSSSVPVMSPRQM
ncbi:hypothetical protein D3C81_1790340 [compost metagenome]